MLKRWLQRAWKRIVDSISCFLREPGRAVAACGLVFGMVFVALVVVLIVSMFVETKALAATVAPLLAWISGGILALIAVIVGAQLGFDKWSVMLPNGVSITAEDARERALERLDEWSGDDDAHDHQGRSRRRK